MPIGCGGWLVVNKKGRGSAAMTVFMPRPQFISGSYKKETRKFGDRTIEF